MGGFKLGKMTLGSLFKKPETVLYPVEKKEAPAGLKGCLLYTSRVSLFVRLVYLGLKRFTPIPVNVREALQAEIDQANKEGDPQLKAAYDEPKAFSGMMALRQIQRRGQLHRMQRKAKPRPARTHWVFRRTRSASWRNMSNTAPRHSPALSNGVEPHSTR